MKNLVQQIKKLPNKPGVYLFKDMQGHILYIGKAKNLKKRGASYLQNTERDLFKESDNLDYQVTCSELEAMILEAQLIRSNQPKFNIIFKTGQPFLYLLFTTSGELKLVRNRKQKGTYFGPFLEKESARKVYDFLIKTFRLKLCKKKIENGCLDYHIGICAGSCRPDFDKVAYQERLGLARQALEKGHKIFLQDLMTQIQDLNNKQEFEHAREIHEYYTAIKRVFSYLDIKTGIKHVGHDVWILSKDEQILSIFAEQESVLKLKHVFYLITQGVIPCNPPCIEDKIIAYYHTHKPAQRILINFKLPAKTIKLYQDFLYEWHHLEQPVTIINPKIGHESALIRYATVSTDQELAKRVTLGLLLKKFLKLNKEPTTIDCFDISHKQGTFMVGSCVRFTNGQPDKKFFRHYHIKTVNMQNDYASLTEIVGRRYKNGQDLPDLVVIDGGKGQLSAVCHVIPTGIDVISLAKLEETVFSEHLPLGKRLDQSTFIGQTLIAIRDYAHHFAISFHRKMARDNLD